KLLIRSGLARYLPGMSRLDGGAEFLHYCSDRVLSAPRGFDTTSLFETLPPDVIDLSCGVPRIDGVALHALRQNADRRAWPSPWGLPQLRSAIADKLLTEQQVAVSPNNEILITHGAAG